MTPTPPVLFEERDGLQVRAYRGDGAVLFAMNLPREACAGLAGFAIARSPDGAAWTYVPNRLGFGPASAVTADVDPNRALARRPPSDLAPFQKFHWVDFPPDAAGALHYRIVARYFVPGKDPATDPASALRDGPAVTFQLDLATPSHAAFTVAFTRGYISSQAFDERYPGVHAIRPDTPVLFDEDDDVPGAAATTWRAMYGWLGAHARAQLAAFTAHCETERYDLDVFAYDLDEPAFVNFLATQARHGRTVRVLLDDSRAHVGPAARETTAARNLAGAGATVRRGHFRRYAHDKCIIARARGVPVTVLTGSANFSVRGLYVQSNSIIVIDDAATAARYGDAFDEAWNDMAGFAASAIAGGWFAIPATGGAPSFAVSFAPHADATVSLQRVADAIAGAERSVLFAVMELAGGGPVLHALRDIRGNPNVFSYGVTQTLGGLQFYKGASATGVLVPFAFLDRTVPAPFRAEWRGGAGQVIHHKFVVVDFNGAKPQVFCGSSNLAAGGETENGDNLLAIDDLAVATLYAVEAIKLVDHYEFRSLQQHAAAATPMMLAPPATPWWERAFDPATVTAHERTAIFGT